VVQIMTKENYLTQVKLATKICSNDEILTLVTIWKTDSSLILLLITLLLILLVIIINIIIIINNSYFITITILKVININY